jgi:sugar lactone lactonase YvrE
VTLAAAVVVLVVPGQAYAYLGIVDKFGVAGSGPGEFAGIHALAVDAKGFVYALDGARIQKFTADGKLVSAFGDQGAPPSADPGKFNEPLDLAADRDGNIYVADSQNHRVQKFTSDGTLVSANFSPGAVSVATDPSGQHFYANEGGSVAEYSLDGQLLARIPVGSNDKIAVDGRGNVYVDRRTPVVGVSEYSPLGTLLASFGAGVGDGPGQFDPFGPMGIAPGPSGLVWVVDTVHGRVHGFSPNGHFITTCRTKFDFGAFDAAASPSGDIYVSGGTQVVRFREVAGGLTPCDVTPPSVSRVSTNSTRRHGRTVSASVRFRLSEPASVTVAFRRSCRGAAANRCTPQRASMRLRGHAGVNALTVRKRSVRRLGPGSCRVTISARDAAGNRSREATAHLVLR